LPALDVNRSLKIIPRIRGGSPDLVELFGRSKVAVSNDTACGAGFATFTDLEKAVLPVERSLNSAETKRAHSAIGAHIKDSTLGLNLQLPPNTSSALRQFLCH
jgi:S-adenosylmethionine synthetase